VENQLGFHSHTVISFVFHWDSDLW